MKITTENNVKQYVLYRVNNVYIGFDDNIEVKLDQVTEFDIDLDSIDYSTIRFTNVLNNIEIANHFKSDKKNHIIYVHIEAIGVLPGDGQEVKVFYDIPCDMNIRRFRLNGCFNQPNMFIELEGIVK